MSRELECDDCQQPYAVWFAPSPVWNFVMGGPDAKDDPGGMLCPRCFTLRAEVAGVIPTAWEVRPEQPFDPGEMSLRQILAEEIKERGGPQSYLDMLANKWMEVDSELPPELSAPIAALKRVAAMKPQ